MGEVVVLRVECERPGARWQFLGVLLEPCEVGADVGHRPAAGRLHGCVAHGGVSHRGPRTSASLGRVERDRAVGAGLGPEYDYPHHRWHQVIEASLREAAALVAGSLPSERFDDVLHLLDHGEPGIALDTLCSHLYEDDIVIDHGVRRHIAHAGNMKGMNPLLWERLAPAPRPDVDTDAWWILTTGEPDDIEHLSALHRELKTEIGDGHVLRGEPFDVLARFSGADEVLVRLTGGRFAMVHPTWSQRAEPPPWPHAVVLPDVDAAQAEVDRIEHSM